jgi:DNA-binding transcriptional LysR family regulator
MQGFDWDHLRHFLEVVKCGSATKAAEMLGVNQSTVSRRLSNLEEQLGASLFDRTSGNNWIITPVGEQLASAAGVMRDQAYVIERLAFSSAKEISGRVRLTLGGGATEDLVMPAILSFCREYGAVELELLVSDEGLDLAAREADIAIRSTDAPPPNVIGKRIGEIGYAVYGSKALYQRYLDGDRDIPCITWLGDGETRPPWVVRNFPECSRIYRVNKPAMALRLLKEGVGLAQHACLTCDRQKSLYRIPVDYVEDGWGLWVLSHVDLRKTPRVRILRDSLVQCLTDNLDLIEGRAPIRQAES